MCTDRDVLNFFSGLNVTEIVFEFDSRTGKTAGNAFVEFLSKQDYEAALDLNLMHMGRRYIEVFPTTREDMEEARRIGFQVSGGPVPGMASTIPKHVNNSQGASSDDAAIKPTYCINITGLPPTITNADLTTYFKEAGALPFAIHIMLKGNGYNAGEAFLEFLSQEHQRVALSQDGAVINDHQISVKDVPFNVMTRIVGRPNNPPPQPVNQNSIGMNNAPSNLGSLTGGGGPPLYPPPPSNHGLMSGLGNMAGIGNGAAPGGGGSGHSPYPAPPPSGPSLMGGLGAIGGPGSAGAGGGAGGGGGGGGGGPPLYPPPPSNHGLMSGLGNMAGIGNGGDGEGAGGDGGGVGFRGGFNDPGGFRGAHRFNGPRMRGGMNSNSGHMMAGGPNDDGPNRRRDPFADGRCVAHASNVPYK